LLEFGFNKGVFTMTAFTNGQTEWEFEDEYETIGQGEFEDEYESVGQGEFEDEYEGEFEDEWEYESVGQGEFEDEYEGEFEDEYESEEFLRKIGRAVRKIGKVALPALRSVAKVAAPLVGTAVGGPLGGVIGRAATSMLESEGEFEDEFEYEGEFEDELPSNSPTGRPTPLQAQAEYMAAVAAQAQSEAEAEAMIGAATMTVLHPHERAELRAILPHLVRGTAILARVLRRHRLTRPGVRLIPSIVSDTSYILSRRATSGRPITPHYAARVMSSQTRRVLSNPRSTNQALRRHIYGKQIASRSNQARLSPHPYARPHSRPMPMSRQRVLRRGIRG
jgi:hypothetical protein